MATTDQTTETPDATPPRPGWMKPLKRYGPFIAIAALVAGSVAIFGGGGGDGDGGSGDTEGAASEEDLIRSGPMTPQKAELEGVDVDFGPNCDTETGKIRLPIVLAAPCVEPFEGDNGGATSPGVTADEIKVVYYQTDPALDPLGAAMIGGAGADVNPATAAEALDGYLRIYNEVFETYGRTVTVERFIGSGAPDDAIAARADAIAIAEKEPFAVIGGPQQSSAVFASELASRGIVCGGNCTQAVPEQIVEEYYPYLWQTGPTPNQAATLAAEMIGKLAGPGPAELAGDPALQEQDRVYALVHFDNPDGDHQAVFESFRDALTDNGIELATDVQFFLEFERMQENARTIISRLKEAGVTTVILYTDPLTPGPLTLEATAQDYQPEWILGPSLLADTTIFGRLTDMEQWSHGFGISLIAARGERVTTDAFQIWDWAYGGAPPNNTANVFEPPLRTIFTAVQLAGPDLTPETFRDGLFRFPVTGGGPTTAQVSRGEHGVWPDLDYGGSDDATIIWFDPETSGEDEVGNPGTGMVRYADGGQRYTHGNFPESAEEAGLFDVDNSVTVYEEIPAEDQTPDYPAPDLPPA